MLDFIKNVIQSIGYSGIAFLMILENVFPPLPSEVIMPFAGFVTGQGELNYWGVVLAGTFGSVLGTLPFYYLGYKIGEQQLEGWVERHGHWLMLTSRDLKRARHWFERYDSYAVLFGRLVPGIRTLISLPAGVERMNFRLFLLLSLLGTGLWVSLLTYLGQILGRHYSKVETYMGPISYLIIGGLAAWYVIHVVRRYVARS